MVPQYRTGFLPYLREVRLRERVSLRELARRAHVGKATIIELEQCRRKAQDRTRDALAEALGVHPWALVFPDEQVRAALREDAAENELIRQRLVAMTDEELQELVNPSNPAKREVARRLRAAIEHADEECERLEAENQPDAG